MNFATASCLAQRFRFALFSVFALALVGTHALSAQTAAPGTKAANASTVAKINPTRFPVYDNKWEIYGALNFMNGKAGQDLPKRYNMGGGEVMATYWLGRRLGVTGDYRFDAGTTPVLSPYYNRIVIFQNIGMGGVQYRGPKNRYAAIDFHALAGITDGDFDYAVRHYPSPGSPVAACDAQITPPQSSSLGLYCNGTAFMGAAGGSVDFNYSPRLAIRLQPDLIVEKFSPDFRYFFSVSGGVMYRFGKR